MKYVSVNLLSCVALLSNFFPTWKVSASSNGLISIKGEQIQTSNKSKYKTQSTETFDLDDELFSSNDNQPLVPQNEKNRKGRLFSKFQNPQQLFHEKKNKKSTSRFPGKILKYTSNLFRNCLPLANSPNRYTKNCLLSTKEKEKSDKKYPVSKRSSKLNYFSRFATEKIKSELKPYFHSDNTPNNCKPKFCSSLEKEKHYPDKKPANSIDTPKQSNSTTVSPNISIMKSDLLNWIRSYLEDGILWLDLTKNAEYLPYYNKFNFPLRNYSKIRLVMDEESDLSLLEKAFSSKTITGFRFDFYSNGEIIFDLFEIIKKKQFNSLTFDSPHNNNKHAEKFIEKLGREITFWSEMEYLGLSRFSKKQVIKTLSILSNLNSTIAYNPSKFEPLKLKKVMILVNDTNHHSIGPLILPSVEELELLFHHHGEYKQDFKDLLSVFPNIKNLYVYVSGKFEFFEIGEKSKLKRLDIQCYNLADEDEYVKYLKEKTNLSSFRIIQAHKKVIDWERINFIVEKIETSTEKIHLK